MPLNLIGSRTRQKTRTPLPANASSARFSIKYTPASANACWRTGIDSAGSGLGSTCTAMLSQPIAATRRPVSQSGGHVDAGLALEVPRVVNPKVPAPAGADQHDVARFDRNRGGALQLVQGDHPARL